MQIKAAPLFEDIAGGPEGGVAHWLTASDGLRIRVGLWNMADAKGTVLIFPGRTEFIERYGDAARALQERGYASLAIDWRGQGIADRLLANRAIGHVERFADYQRDVAAVMGYAEQMQLPRPFYLLGHSMGGCIGLRAVSEGLDVAAVMFSAPMWGLTLAPAMRPVAWILSSLSAPFGVGRSMVPGRVEEGYVLEADFAGNSLTGDADMFATMREQLTRQPELDLGGPSLRWLNQSLREMRSLASRPAPELPCLTFLGTQEAIVDPARIRARMANWPGGVLRVIEGGRHEMLMDSPQMRGMIYDETAAFFARHRPA